MPSSVRTIWTIAAKELSSFFTTSVGYTVILGYVLTTSLFFLLILKIFNEAGAIPPTQRPLSIFYKDYLILFIFMFFASILSMRLFAQEKETGTIEMLLTVPVSDWEVVLGKYLATVAFYVLCISPSLINSLVLFRPEIALNLMRTIILPTLVFLPCIIASFWWISSKHTWIVPAALFGGMIVFAVLLRAAGLDRITQRVAFIPEDQIDFDNDSMSDEWEARYGLDPSRANSREDPDGDGDSNFREFVYGSNPVDPGSNLTTLIVAQVSPENVLRKGDEDRDRDGIPDKYEKWLGLSSEDRLDANRDNDGDGDSNLVEWQYGTDLSDPSKNLASKYRGYLSLKNVVKKDYADRDNDGMPDRWEESYGLSEKEDNSGVDEDGDGFSNIEEYHYRTDPTDPESRPSLPESRAWFLHITSYVLAAGLFLFLSRRYSAQHEDRIAYILKYTGAVSFMLTAAVMGIFILLPAGMKTGRVYSLFLFWGFIPLFTAVTAILSRIALLSRSKLNAAAVSTFLFLVFRLFWTFFIADKAVSQPDVGVTLSGYAGGIVIGAFFIAVGIFFSSLFRNQINAAVVMFAFLVILFLTQFIPQVIPSAEPLKPVLEHYSFIRLLAQFTDGNIHLGNLVFFISSIIMFLFLTLTVLGMRKWK